MPRSVSTPATPDAPGATGRRIARNVLWLGAGTVVERGLGFALSVVLARRLGPDGVGMVGIGLAVALFAGLLVRNGTFTLGIREVARRPDVTWALAFSVIKMRAVLCAIVLTAVVAGLPWLSGAVSVPASVLLIYSLTIVPSVFMLGWAVQGLERMRSVAIGGTADGTVVLLGVLLFVHDASDLILVALLDLCARCVLGAVYWIDLRLHCPRAASEPSPMTPKQLLREGAPLSAAEFGRALYTNGDVLLLGALATTAEAGFFHLSHKVVLTISLASTLMQAAAFPLTSRLYAESPARALNVQRGLLRLGLTVALPAAAFGGLLAADVLQLLFGQGYEGAAPVLALVLWTLPVVAFSGSCRQLLIVSHQADQLLAGVTAGASLHLAAALLLIPEHGALGAAAACLAGEIATALALAVRLRRAIGGIPLDRGSLSPEAPTAAASLALALSSGPWLQQVVLASAVYGVSALAFGAVRPRELRSLFR